MIELNALNACSSKIPSVGDVLIIQTKKTPDKKLLVIVKGVVNGNEVILNKSTNSFYNHDMYFHGESWVARVWNLGQLTPTSSVNNFDSLIDF